MIPVLRTERLVLEPPAPADLEEAAAMWADPGVYDAIGGRVFTREEVWQRLLRYIGHWGALGFGSWTVRERQSGRYVGDVGLMDSRRDTSPSFEGVPEAGWVLAPHAHGRGYAREALAAMFAWADERAIARTVCIIGADNARSLRLAARFGFCPLGTVDYRGAPITLHERLARGGAGGPGILL
jgi:RimJ/RimL family protein N-acetyltransferase